jgi:hypothetical protein
MYLLLYQELLRLHSHVTYSILTSYINCVIFNQGLCSYVLDIATKINTQISDKSHGRLFAVVHVCGKQFKVTDEDLIVIEGSWAPQAGEKIRLEKVCTTLCYTVYYAIFCLFDGAPLFTLVLFSCHYHKI